ncbi:hypothetical protein D1007_26223 [Hordeum vulgare]|nr:hypothetical protein D1007_26223 [Hordeum vulgare]
MGRGEERYTSSWVVDMEKMLADDDPRSRSMEELQWEAQSIYQAMEEHKGRALVHLVKRSKKPLQDFISAIEDVSEELEAAYGKDLHTKWRVDRRSFVNLMLTDGCFLLEIISEPFEDYQLHDPVFSRSGRAQIDPILRSDMLLVENQLPLLVLKKILGVVRLNNCPVKANNGPENDIRNEVVLECLRRALHEGRDIVGVAMDIDINLMVLSFLGRADEGGDVARVFLGHHPLDLYHGSLTYNYGARGDYKKSREYKYEMMPSALEIHEAGIKFRKSERGNLRDIHFEGGVRSMPVMRVDDGTESLYLNLMAFERLRVDAGDLVTAYVICMDHMIVSAQDVAMLSSEGVLVNMIGCNNKTAKLFNGTLSRGQLLGRCYALHKVQYNVNLYCGKPWHKWRATLVRTHFRNPWAFVSLAVAAILLTATLLQTIYAAMPNKS